MIVANVANASLLVEMWYMSDRQATLQLCRRTRF
jgi:hypothetical protein